MEMEYKSMTRRELQALCKLHGLPANLTNSRMSENLASLLQVPYRVSLSRSALAVGIVMSSYCEDSKPTCLSDCDNKQRNSEEMKPKGCLKGSNGSSGEGAGRGGVNKKVSFYMQEDDGERDGSQRDLEARTSPERRRPSRRRSFVVSASKAASEPVLETNGASEVKTRSKRLRSTAAAVVWSPVIEEKRSRNRNNGPDLAVKVPHEEENNRREVDCAPTTKSPSRVVTVTEVKTRSTRRRSTAAAVVRSQVIEEEAQNRNNEPDLAAKVPHQEEDTRRKVDKEDDHCAPTTRSLRNRVVTIGGDEAMQGDKKTRRMQTRGNVKRKEEDVVAPVFDVFSQAQVLEKDENFGSKAHPKRTRNGISTVGLDDLHEIVVPQIEVPPPRRSKRNLAKSHNLFQGSDESGPTSVVSIPHVQKYEKPAGEETKEAAKLQGALNLPKRHTSRIKDEHLGASLPGSLESRDEHPNKVLQKKERKAIRNPDLAVPLPDVVLTETAEDDSRKEKLSDVEEPRRRCTRSSSVLTVLEHETSLAHDVEPVRKNKTRRHERNMKTSKGATEITVPSCETGAAFQELVVQVDPKRVAQTKDTLRRSMRNVPKFASTEFKTSAPLVKSSIIDEHKENKLSKYNSLELQITGNTLADVGEKARRSQRLKKGWVLADAPTEDSTTDCTVGGENEMLEGHRHVEVLLRKSSYNASRRELVMLTDETVRNTRQKKRKRDVVSDKQISIEEVEIAGTLDTTSMQQNAGSNENKERLCENSCEKVLGSDDAIRGNCSTELAVILIDEMTAIKKLASSKRHSNETHEECSEHQIKEDKNCSSMEVEPVAFGLLDTQRTTDSTDGSQESAPFSASESSVAAKHVVSETAGSNHSKLKSANKVQHSPLIDHLTNDECHADQLIESGNSSRVKTLQGIDNLTLMLKEDREISSYNLVEVSSRLQDGFLYVDPSAKAVPGAECRGSADMPSMNSTMDGANYTEERDGQPKRTNIVDSPLPCSHLKEPSPAVATEASTLSSDIMGTLLELNDVSRLSSGGNLCQNYEKLITSHDDNSENCSDDANLDCAISASLSEIPGVEVSSQGKSCACDKSTTLLLVGSEFEKQLEVQEDKFQVEFSAASIRSGKNGSAAKAPQCLDGSENNDRAEIVGTPYATGGTLQFKEESESAKLEDTLDARASSDESNDHSPVNPIKSEGGRNSCIGEDEFQALTKANSTEPADDDEDVSDRRPPPLSILKESNVKNDGGIIIPSKSENSAVIKRSILELQTPVLAEGKDDDVEHDGVKNGSLDASCGFSCSGYEHAKSLCMESAALTNKFNGEPVVNIGEPLDLCGKFQASSDTGERTWGTPQGQDGEEHEAKDMQEKMEMEEVDGQEYSVTHDKEIDENAINASFVTPSFENDSASNCDNNTRTEILASRTLATAETKIVKPEHNLDSCNTTISEITQEASTPEIAQEAVDTVGPEVGDVSLTPQHSECAEDSIKVDMSFSFKKLDSEDDEFDDTKGCDTNSNGVLEIKNDEILRQQLDSKDTKDERSEFCNALQVILDLECSEEADMETCETDSGINLGHTVHDHDEGKGNIFASETSADCLCIASSTKIDNFCLGKLGSLKKDVNVSQRIKSEEVWVAPGATLMCLEDLFDVEQKPLFIRNDNLVGISEALIKAQKMERVSFMSDDNVTDENEEQATLCHDPRVNFDATIEYDNSIQLELSYGRYDSKLMDVAKEHEEQAVIAAWSDGFRMNTDGTSESENAVQPKASTDCSDSEPMDGMVCPDGNSVECLQTVSEKHPASQQNDEDLEISDTVGCQNSSDGYNDESESNVAAEAWVEDLTRSKLVSNPGGCENSSDGYNDESESNVAAEAWVEDLTSSKLVSNPGGSQNSSDGDESESNVAAEAWVEDLTTSKSVSNPGVSISEDRSTICQMETTDTLQTNDRSQLPVETAGNVMDTCTALKKMEWRSVPGTPGYALASPNKQEDININKAGEQEQFNSGCKETFGEGETLDDLKQCQVETIHMNGLLLQKSRVKTQQTLGVSTDHSNSKCGREPRGEWQVTSFRKCIVHFI
ncbi:hypothetical protein BHE74_00010906 [Ensete ventricosum]|nr:hypothetical protein BHE74_00010906 [Ensete ventricosum]